VPAHHAYWTIELLQHETQKFIGPDLWMPNSPDLNPANYHKWGLMQDRVYQTQTQDVANLRQCWLTHGAASSFSQSIVGDTIDEWLKKL